MATYGGIGVAFAATRLVGQFCAKTAGLNASRHTFPRAWARVLGAKMEWHYRTPTGRIINRLSKDVSALDDDVSEDLIKLVYAILLWITGAGIMVWCYPLVSLAVVPLMGYLLLMSYYSRYTTRELERLAALAKSVTASEINQLLHGASVIRIFGKQRNMLLRVLRATDGEQQAEVMRDIASRWVCARTAAVGSFGILLVGFSGLAFPHVFAPGLWGALYSHFCNDVLMFEAIVVNLRKSENGMNHVERVIEYTRLGQEEAQPNVGNSHAIGGSSALSRS